MAALPKYAILENERRFLVREPPDLSGAETWRIEDLYVEGGRLRLRAMAPLADGEPVYKLCKKYGSDDPVSGPIVNIYLSADEHARLADLPGQRLVKLRHKLAPFAIDVFEGPLAGLVLAEVEMDSAEAVRAAAPPAWAAAEVTGEPFFTGAYLAGLTAPELKAQLRRRLGM
jgi:hypothetical protein